MSHRWFGRKSGVGYDFSQTRKHLSGEQRICLTVDWLQSLQIDSQKVIALFNDIAKENKNIIFCLNWNCKTEIMIQHHICLLPLFLSMFNWELTTKLLPKAVYHLGTAHEVYFPPQTSSWALVFLELLQDIFVGVQHLLVLTSDCLVTYKYGEHLPTRLPFALYSLKRIHVSMSFNIYLHFI